MDTPPDFFAETPAVLPDEWIETLLSTPAFRLERIVSRGHASPQGFWYDQDTHEWFLVLKGAARLTLQGEPPLDLVPGSYLSIPAHTRHRVEWTDPTEPTIWLAIHYAPGPEPAARS